MIEGFAEVVRQAREWFERAAAAGWFADAERNRFEAVERATPGDLFENEQSRPLVVALFGGTGVGKSSLLNRIAGAPIALVGTERPTSRETTVYVHEAVKLASLPPELPVNRVQIRRHKSTGQRDVLWIDAPISTASRRRIGRRLWRGCRTLTAAVRGESGAVSGRRRVARVPGERGNKHGWMFVMNRWDEGDPRQRRRLPPHAPRAGFEEPLLLCTSCRVPPTRLPTPDEFGKIQATIRELLERTRCASCATGRAGRVLELQAAVVELAGRFGDERIGPR